MVHVNDTHVVQLYMSAHADDNGAAHRKRILGGSKTNGLTPFDAPSSAWLTPLNQWQYQDGKGNVFVSDDGECLFLEHAKGSELLSKCASGSNGVACVDGSALQAESMSSHTHMEHTHVHTRI